MNISAWGVSPASDAKCKKRESRTCSKSWRGPGQALKAIEKEVWPELRAGSRRSPRKKERQFYFLGYRDPREHEDKGAVEENAEVQLDDGEYPNLGQRLAKRKLSCGQNQQASGTAKSDLGGLKNREDGAEVGRKCCKKPRKTDLICIDLQKALERSLQEPHPRSPTKSRLKVCNLNVNITVRNPLDSTSPIQAKRGKQREIRRSKKNSKLRQVILQERELKRQMNVRKRELFELQKMHAMTKDVSQIDFAGLKITADPRLDADFVKGMSMMTLFSKEHRSPKTESVPEDVLYSKTDVVKKFQDLLIGRTETEDLGKCKTEAIDSDIIDKTEGLKICDETGETIGELGGEETEKKSGGMRHTKRFREYCTNMLTPTLNAAVDRFLSEVTRLQRRMYERDEVKGRCKRRFYAGLKEVEKHIELKKVKIVFIAPDVEKIESEGGLDDAVKKLIETCRRHEIVFCFALSRRKLGYLLHKKGSISCIGVGNYGGTELVFKDVLSELAEARNTYRHLNEETSKVMNLSKITRDILVSDQINSLTRILTATS